MIFYKLEFQRYKKKNRNDQLYIYIFEMANKTIVLGTVIRQ